LRGEQVQYVELSNPSGRFEHMATGVLGLVFVGLALRMVFQEVRAR
jgi:hypothetical protein